MMNTPEMLPDNIHPSRIDFEAIDVRQIEKILKTGDVDCLDSDERAYYHMMEMVRGLRARMRMPGGRKIVTKAGIIKLLKSEPYRLSDWMARRVYDDALNFFYSEQGVTTRAWSHYYAERLDKLADLAAVAGKLREARGFYMDAAKLRGCFEAPAPELPEELVNPSKVIIYTGDAESMGARRADRRELRQFIDSLPEIPEATRRRVRQDAGIESRNLLERMMTDAQEFGETEE